MNIGPDRINLAELREAEKQFLRATETHITALTTPLWVRTLKRLRSGHGPTTP